MKKFRNYFAVLLVSPFLFATCKKGTGQQEEPLKKVRYPWTQFVMGADLSYVNQIEEHGAVYKDSGLAKDPYSLFNQHGANLVRVRLWHNPQWLAPINSGKLYSDIYDVEKTMRRAKAAGMAVNLDLHYSDTWADPDHQYIPAAWNGLSLATMKDSVYNYTLAVLNYFKAKNLIPEMIQIGNETNSGMLWTVGKTSGNDFTAFGQLLNSGIKAVRDFSVSASIKPQIILHEAQLQTATQWFTNITAAGVTDYDVIGLSHYFKWGTINDMPGIKAVISGLKASYPGKKVMIVETGYPFTNQNADSYNNIVSGNVPAYPVSAEGQFNYMRDLTQTVIDAGGTGIMYWEPAWITSSMHDLWGTGSSWENMTLFDFGGNTLPAMEFMNYPYKF